MRDVAFQDGSDFALHYSPPDSLAARAIHEDSPSPIDPDSQIPDPSGWTSAIQDDTMGWPTAEMPHSMGWPTGSHAESFPSVFRIAVVSSFRRIDHTSWAVDPPIGVGEAALPNAPTFHLSSDSTRRL